MAVVQESLGDFATSFSILGCLLQLVGIVWLVRDLASASDRASRRQELVGPRWLRKLLRLPTRGWSEARLLVAFSVDDGKGVLTPMLDAGRSDDTEVSERLTVLEAAVANLERHTIENDERVRGDLRDVALRVGTTHDELSRALEGAQISGAVSSFNVNLRGAAMIAFGLILVLIAEVTRWFL